jgi:hypothetical protein
MLCEDFHMGAGKARNPFIRLTTGITRQTCPPQQKNYLANLPLEIETPACGLAGVIPRYTGFANLRPVGVDRARCRDADLAYEGRTPITAASHTSSPVIDKRQGDPSEVGLIFQ